jgi:hypothetical protein
MNYQALRNYQIKVPSNGQAELDAVTGIILIPPDNKTKIYLHWLNDKGKLVTTYTLNYATLVQNKLRIINGSADPVSLHAIEIGKKAVD